MARYAQDAARIRPVIGTAGSAVVPTAVLALVCELRDRTDPAELRGPDQHRFRGVRAEPDAFPLGDRQRPRVVENGHGHAVQTDVVDEASPVQDRPVPGRQPHHAGRPAGSPPPRECPASRAQIGEVGQPLRRSVEFPLGQPTAPRRLGREQARHVNGVAESAQKIAGLRAGRGVQATVPVVHLGHVGQLEQLHQRGHVGGTHTGPDAATVPTG